MASTEISIARDRLGCVNPPRAMTAFSDRLRGLVLQRIAEGRYRSQAEVARCLGVSEARFGHWTTGRSEPDIASLSKICEELRTHPNYLYGYSDDANPRYTENITRMSLLEKELREIKNLIWRRN